MKQYFQWVGYAAIMALISACGATGKDDSATSGAEELPKVKIAGSSARDVEQIEEYTATVESDVKNNISSNAALRIERILVEVGDRVEKGQVLVQMDASSLHQLKLQVENLRAEFNRMDELYKVGGISKAEWDNAKMQLDVNETSYLNKLENTRLVSPISGVVTARRYDNGDMAGAEPVLTVETLSPVKMLINVSEGRFPLIKTGMPVDVRVDAYGDELFKGKVSLVYPTIDVVTHTFPVEVTLDNSNGRVRPGMFARVTLNLGTQRHTVVPDLAVVKQTGAGDYYVYVYHPAQQTVTYNKVEVGRRLGESYEIISGVDAGAQVVVAGQSRLANNVKVEVVK